MIKTSTEMEVLSAILLTVWIGWFATCALLAFVIDKLDKILDKILDELRKKGKVLEKLYLAQVRSSEESSEGSDNQEAA